MNNLLKSGFEIEKNKDSIIYALDGLVDAVIYKFSIYNNLTIKHSLTRMERAQKNRRELLKKKKLDQPIIYPKIFLLIT